MYYIGYDVGSSSIKAAIVKSSSGEVIAVAQEPQEELAMISHQAGWAEQEPDIWWKYICSVTASLLSDTKINAHEIKGIGIAYQMHGLVVIDNEGRPLRPAIIWCDGRAVSFGDKALADLGADKCSNHLLNSPGNFTASKLKWVKENEPELYLKIRKFMLPGDYIAYKFSNTINTTVPGLSEGILWDFKSNQISDFLLDYYGIDRSLIPDIVKTFSVQARVSKEGATASGLKEGTPILYRAGDQPNNALSLDVF
ncbi:MAG: FGGY family carbohydrate kinase, partial [Flavobacteriaceae bacterium]